MDPSEYEDTVAKNSEVISAGALEVLYEAKPKFCSVDLGKEIGEVHIQIFNLKDQVSKWEGLQLEARKDDFDTKALLIAELKEEYVAKKKTLASRIRQYSLNYLQQTVSPNSIEGMQKQSSELISDFKENFDFLANSAKNSEFSFLEAHKFICDLPSPLEVLEACSKLCLHQQEILKSAQEQLSIAEGLLNEQKVAALPSIVPLLPHVNSSAEIAKLREQLLKSNEESLHYQGEMADLRTRMELELRRREEALRSILSQQQLELQQQYENRLALQEEETNELLTTLNNLQQRYSEVEESGKLLGIEAQKRRDLEEKYRTLVSELSAVQHNLRESQTQCNEAATRIGTLESSIEKDTRQHKSVVESLENETSQLKLKLSLLQQDLSSRPPIDLVNLADRIGIVSLDRSNEDDSGNSLTNKRFNTWGEIESWIIDSIRKSHSEAADSRVKLLESTQELESTIQALTALQTKYAAQCSVVKSLEEDLVAAHNAVESGAALLKCFQAKGVAPSSMAVNNGSFLSGASSQISKSVTSYSKQFKHDDGSNTRSVYSSGVPPSPTGKSSHSPTFQTNNNNNDLEVGAGGSGTARVVMSGLDSSDRMIQAVQSQRDRYMKAAQEKETELNIVRNKMDRLQEEQQHLKTENLELYRRLRVVRANGRQSADNSSSSSSSSAPSYSMTSAAGTRPRNRDKEHGDDMADGLESKYLRMYEEKLDPFRMEELDREAMISKLNVLERFLAYVSRIMMQDSWSRHTLLLYLFLVHIFALVYVVNVLNPQLVEEIDSRQKEQWSAQTLEFDNEKEHPDVRW